ncbi:MAG TPA: D-glycerate dehydrogenase [Aliiroseovarius sp.]|nr:D-glycerate dehydrogenase [Aliiroseovarius sp.]
MSARVLITRPLPDPVLTAASAGFDVTIRDQTGPMDRAEMIAALQNYDAVLPTLGDSFDAAVFDAASPLRCRLLANFGVGFNHIDVAAARAHGVQVSNTPGAVTDATADIAMTLILMTARRAGEGERMLRAGQWQGWHPTQLLGLHISGKTVGIIGMGRIGQAIARRCHFGFGMKVVYANRSAKDLPFPADKLASINAVAAAADVVVVALPGAPDTHHMIGAQTFAAMQNHAIFVNIARGDIVDEAALISALETGQIAGAGLDVYEFEPRVPAALTARENVTLLPHLGTNALAVRTEMGLMAVDNLRAFFAGKPLPNPV